MTDDLCEDVAKADIDGDGVEDRIAFSTDMFGRPGCDPDKGMDHGCTGTWRIHVATAAGGRSQASWPDYRGYLGEPGSPLPLVGSSQIDGIPGDEIVIEASNSSDGDGAPGFRMFGWRSRGLTEIAAPDDSPAPDTWYPMGASPEWTAGGGTDYVVAIQCLAPGHLRWIWAEGSLGAMSVESGDYAFRSGRWIRTEVDHDRSSEPKGGWRCIGLDPLNRSAASISGD